jgi:hypothetical protein
METELVNRSKDMELKGSWRCEISNPYLFQQNQWLPEEKRKELTDQITEKKRHTISLEVPKKQRVDLLFLQLKRTDRKENNTEQMYCLLNKGSSIVYVSSSEIN